jgi:sarcosine oxidase, subunit beta
MIGLLRKHRFFRSHDLRASYDAVVIGGGAHGMATAYYLAKDHGMKNVAVIEQSYIGAGASGRNTTIIRSNYLTPEGARFYEASVKLYESLSQELNFNMLFSQHGHLTLAHSDRSVNTMMERAEVNRLVGVDSRVVYPDEIGDLCPQLDISDHPTFPILAALYHPPGGVIRHDAVVWGYGKEADKMGVEIHQYTDVTAINVERGKVTGVETNRGRIACDTVISCVAGWSTLVCDLVGVPLPLTTHILQACVTEPVKPLLDKIIVSGTLHIYISQSDRGEFVMGSEIEPYSGYSNTSTFRFIEDLAMHMIELLPMLGHAKILRQWTGYCDVSPDYSPIMGLTEVEGFIIDAGWGTYGFKASPIVGFTIADLIGTGKIPDLIQPFRWARFYENDLVSERGAAAVSH